ncbi:MAG TPA: SigE family RNA polymerase sigma factor [Mycobacteriales bacterium]|nr:SigE family RNA polymerase sigma factor [Mycobacteriales bacterium]
MRGAEGDAFAGFVRARYGSLLRFAYLLTADRGHAEDLVQDGLARTYGAWSRLREPAAADAYTRTTLVRLALRARRRRWRGETPTPVLPEQPADGGDPDLAESVRAALAALPADQRAVLVLRYYDDRTEREIAALLDCSPGTVKSRAARGLAALREAGLLDGVLEGDRRDRGA